MHHLKIYFYGVLWQKGRFRCFIKEQPWFSEKAMAPHSSTLAWKIPWTGEPGGLQSMGSQRVGHDWATSLSCIGEGTGNPLQCSSLENPRDRGALWAAIYGVTQSRTRLKRLSNLAVCDFSGSDGKESDCNVGDLGSIPGLGRSLGGGHGNPLQYSCLENHHGQRSLVGYSPWGCKELDMTEWLSTFSFPKSVSSSGNVVTLMSNSKN